MKATQVPVLNTVSLVKREARLFGDFVFGFKCRDYCEAYVTALKILKEAPKDRWTPDDAVDAVLRAYAQARGNRV